MPLPLSSTDPAADRFGPAADPEEELDEFVRAFELAHAGGGGDLADFLPPEGHPLYPSVLRELVRVDMEYRWEGGAPRRLDEYRRDFPALANDPDALREIAFEEFRLRYQAGEAPSPDEYRDRYGVDLGPRGGRFGSVFRSGGSAAGSWGKSARPEGSWAEPPGIGHDGASSSGWPEAGGRFLNFRLIRELGRGSFGRVFLARQGELAGRAVVLKVTRGGEDESQTLAQLQHGNIVPVYSRHRAGRLRAVCMPYLGAVTLRDVYDDLKTQGTLPDTGRGLLSSLGKNGDRKGKGTRDAQPDVATTGRTEGSDPEACPRADPGPAAGPGGTRDADEADARTTIVRFSYVDAVLWMAARLADGLAHAHDRGILHRDLKPANVLLTDDGRPMLLDFNLAADLKRPPADSGRNAALGGTLPYMPPEQLDAFCGGSRPVDARSDVYGLGVILFELLTGRPPSRSARGRGPRRWG